MVGCILELQTQDHTHVIFHISVPIIANFLRARRELFCMNIKLLYCNWNRYDNGLYLSSFSLCLLLHFALLFHFGASTTPSRGP